MKVCNPNKFLYGICIETTDYFETTDKAFQNDRLNRKFWKVPKIFCFITYFPFTKLFTDIMVSILSIILFIGILNI